MSTPENASPTGWAVFAAVVLLIVGCFNVVFGLAAILNEEIVTVSGTGVIVWSFTTWGWIHLIVGAIMILVSFGLFAARGWARTLAIVFATLNAIAQVGLITAFPLWSILVIALDIIVIYQLATRPWEPARS